MHRLDTLRFKIGLQREVEVWGIDTHEEVGTRAAEQSPTKLISYAHDAAVMAQYLPVATHREFFARPPSLKPLFDHARPTNTGAAQARPTRLKALQEQTR
jgi:hypothetical protein